MHLLSLRPTSVARACVAHQGRKRGCVGLDNEQSGAEWSVVAALYTRRCEHLVNGRRGYGVSQMLACVEPKGWYRIDDLRQW